MKQINLKLMPPALLCAAMLLLLAGNTHTAFFELGARQLALEALEKLTPAPDLSEPPVRFAIRSEDPDFGVLSPVDTEELGDIQAWQLQILDRSGRKVSFIQGKGRLPGAILPWSGLSDGGEPLPSGFYNARLAWLGADKKARATKNVSFSLFTPLEISSLAEHKLKFIYTPEGLVIGIQEKMIFNPGEVRILEEAIPALREISAFLKTYSRNGVIIRGYTDSSGTAGRNLALSRARAERVYAYLAASGIAPQRLAYEGLGSASPVAPNQTEAGRARNRRVEVVVLKTAG
ncbi:MAG TPA: OmpA family protein [Elusimicrobiales bacterium]|nr:OmpA family protein [Elusimicrobiales bacterium]